MAGFAEKVLTRLFPAEPGEWVPVLTEMPKILSMPLQGGLSYEWHDGESYPGGYGPTPILVVDYWTLRQRSEEMFERNIYARGMIRRLVTAIIGPGLFVESTPEPEIVGMSRDQIDEWTEQVELLFELWAADAELCDHAREKSFGAQQQDVFREALVCGDVLSVTLQDPITGLPKSRKISGKHVRAPLGALPSSPENKIVHGVEIAPNGEHVAYFVQKSHDEFERIPARAKSGRRVARLVYGSDMLLDGVRGQPILALALQSLKEIGRYRDSVQRKALISSLLTFFVTKSEAKIGSGPMRQLGGGFSKGVKSHQTKEGESRFLNVAKMVPGLSIDELQAGEDIKSLGSQGTDEKFADFEAAIVSAVAWHLEIPPEIAGQRFSSNYSASQAANNEFALVIDVKRETFGEQYVKPAYREVLLSLVVGDMLRAPGMLSAWKDRRLWPVFGSWMSCEMSGAVKPSVDPLKLSKALQNDVEQGFISRAAAARMKYGVRFSKVVRQLKKENAMLSEANDPIAPYLGIMSAQEPPEEEQPQEQEAEEEALGRIDPRMVPGEIPGRLQGKSEKQSGSPSVL